MTTLVNDKIYNFNLGDLAHMGLTHDEMCAHYNKNSSPAGFMMEKIIVQKFSNLDEFKGRETITEGDVKTTINPDMKNNVDGHLYDQKTVNDKGVNFKRSKFKGAGRKLSEDCIQEHDLWVNSQSFIFVDIRKLPEIRIVSRAGTELIKKFPKHNINKNNIENIFECWQKN